MKDDKLVYYYAFACPVEKTFYIQPSMVKKYQGVILLFELGCRYTDKPLYSPDKSQPVVGGIYATVNDKHVEVYSVDWV